jgi:hypothetical protein
MLRRFAATAACVLALDYSLSHAPLPGPSNASVVSAAMAARPVTPPSNEMFTLRAKYGREIDSDPVAPVANSESDSLLERAGRKAMDTVEAVREFAYSITGNERATDSGLDMRPAPKVWPKLSREETCNAIEMAALEHKLPSEFLGRLIWQESRHNPQAVSHAGAQGIAQFMPATAADMKLKDPFDPVASLLKSAEFLRMLHDRFGNVGLAAAAYNGGAGRLERWLEAWEKSGKKKKKPSLPEETQNYVRIITGKPVTEWIGVKGEKAAELKHKNGVPCVRAPKVIEAKVSKPEKKTQKTTLKLADKN